MKQLLICFCLCMFMAVASRAETEIYPANQEENHYIGKCDSNVIKKRAHKWGFMSYQKSKDVEMQTRCFDTCDILAKLDAAQAVSCVRECNDREREQRARGLEAGSGILNLLGLGAALLK